MAQLMPLPLTVSCFSKIQIGFTFLVPAHLGSPGQRAVKRMYVMYVPSGTLCQTLDLRIFATRRRSSQRVVNLVWQRWTLSVINQTIVGRTKLTILATVDVWPTSLTPCTYHTESLPVCARGSASRGSIYYSWYLYNVKTPVYVRLLLCACLRAATVRVYPRMC